MNLLVTKLIFSVNLVYDLLPTEHWALLWFVSIEHLYSKVTVLKNYLKVVEHSKNKYVKLVLSIGKILWAQRSIESSKVNCH